MREGITMSNKQGTIHMNKNLIRNLNSLFYYTRTKNQLHMEVFEGKVYDTAKHKEYKKFMRTVVKKCLPKAKEPKFPIGLINHFSQVIDDVLVDVHLFENTHEMKKLILQQTNLLSSDYKINFFPERIVVIQKRPDLMGGK